MDGEVLKSICQRFFKNHGTDNIYGVLRTAVLRRMYFFAYLVEAFLFRLRGGLQKSLPGQNTFHVLPAKATVGGGLAHVPRAVVSMCIGCRHRSQSDQRAVLHIYIYIWLNKHRDTFNILVPIPPPFPKPPASTPTHIHISRQPKHTHKPPQHAFMDSLMKLFMNSFFYFSYKHMECIYLSLDEGLFMNSFISSLTNHS